MNIKLLFRPLLAEENELNIASQYLPIITKRSDIKLNDVIIPRYSSLPYYQELEEDCINNGAFLINSFSQHNYVADIQNWYNDLKEFTPKTWFRLEDIDEEGPYILKGNINSKKFLWNTHMFVPANDRQKLLDTYFKLQEDSLIGPQGICIRKYHKYITYPIEVICGPPVIREFRIFCYKKQILTQGFYWTSFPEIIEQYCPTNNSAREFINKIINRLKDKVNFYVIDIAQDLNYNWQIIELNCGTMSGLSCCNPYQLYYKLANIE